MFIGTLPCGKKTRVLYHNESSFTVTEHEKVILNVVLDVLLGNMDTKVFNVSRRDKIHVLFSYLYRISLLDLYIFLCK